MDDDITTPKAIASLFELSRETNEALAANSDFEKLQSLYKLWRLIGDDVLGIVSRTTTSTASSEVLDNVIETVINWRMEARAAKDFKMSDAIRDDLARAGVVLEDGKDGTG
jgi:cysteinyl-tRNA synthetase